MALAALATLLGATLQSATGFGFALVLGPAAFAVFEPAEALTILLVLGAVLSVLMLFAERRPRQVQRATLVPILLTAVPGLIAGVFILRAVSKPGLQVAVGVAVLVAVVIQVRAGDPPDRHRKQRSDPIAKAAIGLVTGTLTTTTGTSGPPLVLWFQRIGLSPAEMRDTLAAAFLALDVLGALALALVGTDDPAVELGSLALLATLTILGGILGRRLFLRLDPGHFRVIGITLVIAAGAASVVAGAAA